MSARAHFRIAGIPVHVQPVFFVIAGLFGFRYIDIGLDVVLVWMATSFVSILVHELGHGLSLKVFGQPSAIVLHGFGGVTISPRRTTMTKARSVVVSLAGSLTAMVVLWLPTRTLFGSDWFLDQPRLLQWAIYFLAFQNLWWSVANLLPIRPLDGGNVTAELFGISTARRASIVAALAGAVFAFTIDQGYAAFFALFLAFNNWQELKAEREGGNVDAFHVDAPDTGASPPGRRGGRRSGRRRGGPPLRSVPADPGPVAAGAPTLTPSDPARAEQQAWGALRAGDAATAKRMAERAGAAASPFLTASVALVTGDPSAFERFEAAYVAQPGGPPSLVATEVLARSGAAAAVAKRLVGRPDGAGREGAATLQTHLHYGDRFTEAAEVGEVVFAAGPTSPAQTAFEVACSWARAGQVDKAVAWLDRAAEAGFRAASLVDGEPDLAPVRSDPRWPLLRTRLT